MRSVFVVMLAAIALTISVAKPSSAREFKALMGQFLIAENRMDDPNFSHSVVLIVSHDRGGALGLIVNREIGRGPLKDLLDSLGVESPGHQAPLNARVHFGGPVEFGRAFVLHSEDYREPGTLSVIDGVALSSDLGVLTSIAKGEGPSRFVVLLGYAGWGPGQLEAEIKRGGWETAPADVEISLDADVKTKWERAIAKVFVLL